MGQERIEIDNSTADADIVALIEENATTLRSFRYRKEGVPSVTLVTVIANALNTASALEDIDFNTEYFDEECSIILAQTLSNPQIKKISIEKLGGGLVQNMLLNRVSDTEVSALAHALTNTQVTHFSLESYLIKSHRSVRILAEALQQIPTLEDLGLYGCNIGPLGMQAIVDVVRTSSRLRTLNIARNLIGYSGARALADALPSSSLETLDGVLCGKVRNFPTHPCSPLPA